MRDRLNCPNCGAPITGIECPYCGAMFFDVVTLDDRHPTYIRMRWNDQIITSRVVMTGASMCCGSHVPPTIAIELLIVPDKGGVLMIKEERTNECT